MMALAPLPAEAAAQTSAPPPQAAEAPHPRAVAMALLFIPRTLLEEVAVRGGKRGFFASMSKGAGGRELEQRYPGITAALWAAAEPEVRRAMVEEHPQYLDRIASVYSSRLTPAELEALYQFYSTPTGRKMLGQIHRGMAPDAMMEEVLRTGELSPTAMQAAVAAESRKFIATLTMEDRAAILGVMRSVPKAKMERLNADLIESLLQWVDKTTEQLSARLQPRIMRVAELYMREHPPKN
jgi:hypothetical protein